MPTKSHITKLNPTQLHILNMFNYAHSKKDLDDLKDVLAKYYAEKVDDEMDKIWVTKKLSQTKLEKMSKEHRRTPYKK
jgi:hypothetical protein